MKTYKTWEMIREIIKNPKKKYRPVNDTNKYVEFKDNQLVWKGQGQVGQPMIVTETDENEWVEVKKPVDFMTAFRAFRNNKNIRVKRTGMDDKCFNGRSMKDYSFHEEDIEHGKWYIED